MKKADFVRAWGRILRGMPPALSIEITRECPLRCPGCYAYHDAHLGGGVTLRQLADLRGEALVHGVLAVVDRLRPLHVSLVGGDPLVRHRELEALLPQLRARRIAVQVVTSAFRPIPAWWAEWDRLTTSVSIDGLAAEHDARRYPATYERILKNIRGGRITIHCTVTAQMMTRPGYLGDFLDFWTPQAEIEKVWFSIFTPQRGERSAEVLSPQQRRAVIADLLELRRRHPKLSMGEGVLREFLHPPPSPDQCLFAQTTQTISADLRTRVTPCQFGGDPDCSQCGCIASMGLAAAGHHRLGGLVKLESIFRVSTTIGSAVARLRGSEVEPGAAPFPIIGQTDA